MAHSEKYNALKQVGLKLQDERVLVLNEGQRDPLLIWRAVAQHIMKKGNSQGQVYLAMYDITSDKVRRLVANYFEKNGFRRVQKSVYLGNLSSGNYRTLVQDIKEMNTLYKNQDSFIFMPLSEGLLDRSHFLGKELDFQLIRSLPSQLIL
jgi:CRISPR-associated endonuclease Cas2